MMINCSLSNPIAFVLQSEYTKYFYYMITDAKCNCFFRIKFTVFRLRTIIFYGIL